MKKLGIYISIGIGAAFLAAPSYAQEDDEPLRFSSEDFLDEYNLFLGEASDAAEEPDVDLKLNLDSDENVDDKDFIYFKKNNNVDGSSISLSLAPVGTTQSAFTPRKTTLTGNLENVVLPSGEALSLTAFTPRYTSADISFSLGSNKNAQEEASGFQISLASQFSRRNANVFGSVNNDFVNEALGSQVYDLGLNVGYSDFNLGASVRGEESVFYKGITGYDVGLSYQRPTWSTSILFGEYQQNGNYITSSLNSPYLDTRFFAIELGAAYHLAPWVRFVGSFRMYEDPDLFIIEGEKIGISQMFYLGTRVNF
ncbi:MAG: hypothetical protein V3R64_01410 [Sphingomonadales bacterium]